MKRILAIAFVIALFASSVYAGPPAIPPPSQSAVAITGGTISGVTHSDLDASKVVVTDGDKKLDSSSDITAFVAAATTDAAGKVELSTDAEAIAGTATDKAITPANIRAVISDDMVDAALSGTPVIFAIKDTDGNAFYFKAYPTKTAY